MSEKKGALLVKHFKAFTLIEMLVVICIIGILAAMLLPALQNALSSARLTYCMNQMKGLYLGVLTTAEEQEKSRWLSVDDPNRDKPGEVRFTQKANDSFWTQRVRLHYFQGSVTFYKLSNHESTRFDQADNAATGGQSFICPVDTQYHEATPDTDWYWVKNDSFSRYSSYVMPYSTFGLVWPAPNFVQLKSPSKTILLTEGHGTKACACSPANALGLPARSGHNLSLDLRHNGFVNCLFSDGHAKTYNGFDIYCPKNKADQTNENTYMWFGTNKGNAGLDWWKK